MPRHLLWVSFLSIIAFASRLGVAALPTDYTWIKVPEGVTYDQDSDSICIPSSWTDIVSFFLGNYIAHAATVVTLPGEPQWITAFNLLLAMLWPSFGCGRGLVSIFKSAVLLKDPLKRAQRAGALVMVTRSPRWEPIPGEPMRSMTFCPRSFIHEKQPFLPYYKLATRKDLFEEYIEELKETRSLYYAVADTTWRDLDSFCHYDMDPSKKHKIFGDNELPPGYEYSLVPPNAALEPTTTDDSSGYVPRGHEIIQSSHSFGSPLIAVFQIIYAAVALYQSRGYQVQQYGYAAFGFTVLPYLVMSFVNFLGNLATPNYESLYLVHTEIMDEAIKRGGRFTDVVGDLPSDPVIADDVFLMSGMIELNEENHYELNLSRVYKLGETEPLTEDFKSAEEDYIYKNKGLLDSSEGNGWPSLIFPDCYNFKVTYKRRSMNVHGRRLISFRPLILNFLGMVISAMPLLVIGVMSNFEAGESSLSQRIWVMAWLIVGITCTVDPYLLESLNDYRELLLQKKKGDSRRTIIRLKLFTFCLFFGLLTVLPIGRMVVVGNMVVEYGICTDTNTD